MKDIITLNNQVHSWLDDQETIKLAVLVSVVIIASVGPAVCSSAWGLVTIVPMLIAGISRWHYVVKGHYVGKR